MKIIQRIIRGSINKLEGGIENSPINATSGDFIELLKKKDEQIDRLLTLLEKK